MNGLTRKLVIALAVSAALNLFLLGFMAARHLGRPGRGGPGDGMGPEVRALWAPHRERLRPVHEAVRHARQQVREALLAEPFDRAALQDALATLREATGSGQEAFHAALVEVAAGMDAAGRRKLAHSRRLWRDGGPGAPGPRRPGMGPGHGMGPGKRPGPGPGPR